ncbi:glycosyltransferase [Vibrio maerlii]|uniref:glycosyltransferase n=1 Tax=Vibrio maerlii TaxID=2231648 RepID=UPI000E3B9986|nr:glycosyltransferase [Vibrio maerlii]
MKILHIINDLSRNGGAQKFLIDLISNKPQDIDVSLLLIDKINDYQETLSELGIEYFYLEELNLKQKLSLLVWPHIVHAHLSPSIYLSLLFCKSKLLQTEHNSHNRRRDLWFMKPFEFLLYLRFNQTICITDKVKEELTRFMPYFTKKYTTIYNGIELDQFSQRQRNNICGKSIIKLGMVGRLHPYKDQQTIIRSLKSLSEKYQLHLAGGGETQQELAALALELGVEKRVHFHGVIDTVPLFLDDLDVYIQSSNVEGFGLGAVEAMASGLPVIGSRVPGLDEVIGRDQMLFKQNDPQALSKVILSVCESDEEYRYWSQYSLNRCQDFALTNFITGYYQAYDEIYQAS